MKTYQDVQIILAKYDSVYDRNGDHLGDENVWSYKFSNLSDAADAFISEYDSNIWAEPFTDVRTDIFVAEDAEEELDSGNLSFSTFSLSVLQTNEFNSEQVKRCRVARTYDALNYLINKKLAERA